MYAVCIRHIWRNAMKELNVPEQGILRIKYNPWERITIPQSDDTVKQAKSPNAMRTFFSCPILQLSIRGGMDLPSEMNREHLLRIRDMSIGTGLMFLSMYRWMMNLVEE